MTSLRSRRSLSSLLVASGVLIITACGSSTSSNGSPATSNGDGGSQGSTSPACATAPTDLASSQNHEHSCGLGDDARSFVRGAPYSKIIIEVGSTKSATPSQAAISHLMSVMGDLLDKPGGVTVVTDAPVDDVSGALSISQVAAMEDASRAQYSMGDTAVFYYLVVSTNSTDDNSAGSILGEAYRPSAMVVFQKTIDANSGGLGQPTRDVVESTVVAHEFGHILGLVNTGTPMQTPHEDSAHPKHDVNTACLMYWANNSSAGLANLLTGGNVPDYDANCRADLAALKN
ncbi:MAG: peptidase [Polyangiaceae bacterium]